MTPKQVSTEGRDGALKFAEELRRSCPQVEVQTLSGRKVVARAPSPEHVSELLDKAAELQMRWFLEKDIYIEVSVIGSGPLTG